MADYQMDDESRAITKFADQIAEEARKKATANKLKLVPIAVLSSLQGTMAGNERQVAKATLLAAKRVNDESSYLQLIPRIYDGESTTEGFRRRTQEILELDKTLAASSTTYIAAIFGCWTSASRKTVQGLLRQHESATGRRIPLFYPVQFEGLEMDPYTVYGGATPNQQLRPVLRWQSYLLKQGGAGNSNHMKPFVVGSDYVYPRASAMLVNELLDRFDKEPVKPHFIPFAVEALNDNSIVNCIKEKIIPALRDAKPDFILNFINGDANSLFFTELFAAGAEVSSIPTISFSLTPADLHAVPKGLLWSANHYIATTYLHAINSAQSESFAEVYCHEWKDEETSDAMWNAYALVHIFAKAVQSADSPLPEDVLNTLRRNENTEAEFSTGNGDVFRLHCGTLMAVKNFHLGRLVAQDGVFRIEEAKAAGIQDTLPLEPEPFLGIDAANHEDWEHWVNVLFLISDVFPHLQQQSGLLSFDRAREWLLDDKNHPFDPRKRKTWSEMMTDDGAEFGRQLLVIGKYYATHALLHDLHQMQQALQNDSHLQNVAAEIAGRLRSLRCRDGDLSRLPIRPTSVGDQVFAAAKGKALACRHRDRIYLFDFIDHCQHHHNHKVFVRKNDTWDQASGNELLLRLLHEDLSWKNDARWNVHVFRSFAWGQPTGQHSVEQDEHGSIDHFVVECETKAGQMSTGYGMIAVGTPKEEVLGERGLSTSLLFEEFQGSNLRCLISASRVLFADLKRLLKDEKYGTGNIHLIGEMEVGRTGFLWDQWLNDRIQDCERPGLWIYRWRNTDGRYNIAVAGWCVFPVAMLNSSLGK